jgi:signal transduction histidine kinase/PAS domain-containing protein
MSRKEAIPDHGGQPRMLLQQQARVHKRHIVRISMWRRPFTGYLFSIPFFALISLGILRVQHLFPHFYFFEGPLLLAVMVIALIWGVGPALFSAIISTAALAYFYIPAFQSLNFTAWDDVLPIVPYFFSAVILAVITGQRESARRRAHIAEQEEQERASELEAIFEAMADGVIVYDDTGHILRTNAAARKLFALDTKPKAKFSLRLRREQRPALVILDEQGQILPEEQSPLMRILNGEVLTSSNAMDVILRMQSGDEVQLNVTGAPVYSFGGHPIGAICVFRDVTERRHLERRTQDALNALVEMAKALVQEPFLGDRDSARRAGIPEEADSVRELPAVKEQTSVVTEVARRLAVLTCSVLGCRRVGMSTVEPETNVLHPVVAVGLSPEQERHWWGSQQQYGRLDDSPYPELVSRLRSNEILTLDKMLPPSLDQLSPYDMRGMLVAPMFVGDQLVGILSLDYGGIEHEYTAEEMALAEAIAKLAALVIERERLLYERAKAQANELALREANRRMDEFLGVVGHELKTPLTAINGNIQLAERQLKKSINEDGTFADDLSSKLELVQNLLGRAGRQVKLQNRLVGDLLDVSSIQANKIALRLEPCDLASIVREAVQDQSQMASTRIIRLQLPAEATVPVLADLDRIGQVITNYMSNALKYSPADRPIEVSLAVEGKMARVSVRDEGPGLSAEEQQSIWERFYQVERVKTQSGSAGGLGLGLHICRTIIEQHQGQVGVQSTPDEGSTFWFTLPLSRDKA